MTADINIIIADDHHLILNLLQTQLNSFQDFKVVGYAEDGEQVLKTLSKSRLDVLLLDINMPKVDGFTLLPQIIKQYPDTKVIMLTNLTESCYIKKSLQLGAHGYITKFADINELITAIKTVVIGDTFFCRTSFRNLISNVTKDKFDYETFGEKGYGTPNQEKKTSANSSTERDIRFRFNTLTSREREVLRLIAEDKKTKDISDSFFISCRTVETHRKNILQKMEVKSSISLMKIVVEHSLISKYYN